MLFCVTIGNASPSKSLDPVLSRLSTAGNTIVDRFGNPVLLFGTNIGGWLVFEGWMCGITDVTEPNPTRFVQETMEARFGVDQSNALVKIWQDHWFTTIDLDTLSQLGVNVIRVPFSWRTLQTANGTWLRDSSGNIDFSRLDWVVREAGARGIYVILCFHVWRTQQQSYSYISTMAASDAQQWAVDIWTEVAAHFKGNGIVAAFDTINEPHPSTGNFLQKMLCDAIWKQDATRIAIVESVMSSSPTQNGWTNRSVVYGPHQYTMQSANFTANQIAFQKDLSTYAKVPQTYNSPLYVGEFQTNGADSWNWLTQQYRQRGWHFTSWTYKTVNAGQWGIYAEVNVTQETPAVIAAKWSRLNDSTLIYRTQVIWDAFYQIARTISSKRPAPVSSSVPLLRTLRATSIPTPASSQPSAKSPHLPYSRWSTAQRSPVNRRASSKASQAGARTVSTHRRPGTSSTPIATPSVGRPPSKAVQSAKMKTSSRRRASVRRTPSSLARQRPVTRGISSSAAGSRRRPLTRHV